MNPIKRNEHPDSNALGEVALALAMAFFSVMVLALLSMGVPASQKQPSTAPQISVAPAHGRSPEPLRKDVQFFAYFAGSLLTKDLEVVAFESIPAKSVVAVPKSLSIEEVLALQTQISSSDPVITILNAEWLNMLERKFETSIH